MERSVPRRRVLAAVGAAGFAGLAGCGGFGTRTELAGVQALNPYYGRARIDIRVEQAGGTVFEEPLSVVQGEGATRLPCSWERGGEEPTVGVRLAGENEWEELDLAELDAEAVLAQAIARPDVGARFVVVRPDEDAFRDVCAREA